MEKKVRINKYDNLKGLAIFLVVFAHLDVLRAMGPANGNLIFLIHLPVLFFVAGYFSKIGPDQPLKSFKRLFIPYIIFCMVTKLFNFAVFGKFNLGLIFFESEFALWFLIALFFMKMALPIVDKFRYPIITALICAILVGFVDIHPNYLGLTRGFSYFPIFLVGFYFKQSKEGLTTRYSKIIETFNNHRILISILICVITIPVIIKFQPKFFLFKTTYSGNVVFEMIKKLIVLILQIGWVMMLDSFMTNKELFLTKFGRNSMAVYILHCYVRIYLKPILPEIFANYNPVVFLALMFLLALAITYVFSRDIVTKYLNKFTDSIYDLIVKPINS